MINTVYCLDNALLYLLQGNYVPVNDDVLNFQEPEYDIIMCLSVSKWIHLNFGDEGLKRMFQRVFKQLRPGGKFVFEPQPWKSYMRKKKLTVSKRRLLVDLYF